MRWLLTPILSILAFALPVWADPTTLPSASPASVSVMIFPFRQLDNSGHAWMADALREDLTASVSRIPSVRVIPYDRSLAAAPPDAAVAAAKTAQADYVVFGTYEIVDDEFRVNGQLQDIPGDRKVDLQASGAVRDFFKVEDSLADQLRRAIPQTGFLPGYYAPATSYSSSSSYYSGTPDYYPQASYPSYSYGDTNYGVPYYPYSYSYTYPYSYNYGYPYYGYSYWTGFPYFYFNYSRFNHFDRDGRHNEFREHEGFRGDRNIYHGSSNFYRGNGWRSTSSNYGGGFYSHVSPSYRGSSGISGYQGFHGSSGGFHGNSIGAQPGGMSHGWSGGGGHVGGGHTGGGHR